MPKSATCFRTYIAGSLFPCYKGIFVEVSKYIILKIAQIWMMFS
jgi:hypothetical protein